MSRFSPFGLFQEARRRRVLRLAAMYIVGAFVVLQVADLAFPGLGVPESAIQFVWIGAIIGLPFALIFGWRFDLVDGQVLHTAVDPGDPGLPIKKADRLTLVAMSVVLVAVTLGLGFEISKTRGDDPARRNVVPAAPNSVAVLPFVNFGGAAENEYLADGITETLLHALAQASGLKVTARTSSFFYKGQDIDVRDIAAELGVSKILEGSVQQSGDKIRIVAQLIEAETGFHLWSNTFDRDLGDIFAIQDSIANNVAIAILATMTAAPGLSDTRLTGVSTTNLEAYQKYLLGLEQARILSNASLPKAEVLFQQALAIDPDFFEATKELAYTYFVMGQNGTISWQVSSARILPLRDKLLKDHPDDGMSISMDALLRYLQDRESIDVDDLVARTMAAIERNPNDTRIHYLLSRWLRTFDRRDEAMDWLNRAIIVDPMDFMLHFELGDMLNNRDEHQAAIEAFERVIEINPQWPSGHSSLAWASWNAGDHVVWYQEFIRATELDPLDYEMEVGLAQGLLALGLVEEARAHVGMADKIEGDKGGVWQMSSFLSLLGDLEQSRILTESYLRREPSARGGMHLWVVMPYVSASIEEGQVNDALAVLEDVWPDVSTADYIPASQNEFYIQFWATVAWARGKEISEVSARLDKLAPHWNAARPNWDTTALYSIPVAFLCGDLEKASTLSVEYLGAGNLQEASLYRHIYPFNIVAAQPAVAARLAELEQERHEGAIAVRAYIEQNDPQDD